MACQVGSSVMAIIRVLPDTLASQVAAGEVVERPASVVKELVENSIDAGAKEVRVEIRGGGVSLIRVEDDGCGMSRDDALLCLERHATSKLREAADLAAICTLGFRGEAVPSIASVSRFRLITREPDAVAGTEIQVDGGKLRDVRDAGCAPGTTIEAKSLFFNMPARRKFLRAESSEAAHVEHQLRLHALAAPWMRLRYRRNDKEVLDLAGVEKRVDRVRQLVGPELAGELIELPRQECEGVAVEGFVLPANHARKGRRHQHVFLNGRPVEDAVISRALAEGFRGAVADGLHPAAWLWIELDPALVDVNVHPAKREIRLHRPGPLKQAIVEAVVQGLEASRPEKRVVSSAPRQSSDKASTGPPVSRQFESVVQSPQAELGNWQQTSAPEEVAEADGTPNFRAIGVLHQRYVLLESEDGLVVLDPKAAWQRIWYEKLMAQEDDTSQGLLVPLLLELDPRDSDLLLQNRDALAAAGIELDDFGGSTVQVSSLPACLPLDEPRQFITELVDALLHESVKGAQRFALERMARLCAQRASAGLQTRLSEVPELLKSLYGCDLPYATPAGQPTMHEISLSDLGRRFDG
ncbi:MAG: DNA mismatch repair endonuclease MutL [Akkermansiaceae bacterium]|nr:DNA mismatch repair endonuclease MutL [Akkermansiaceae bacterium]